MSSSGQHINKSSMLMVPSLFGSPGQHAVGGGPSKGGAAEAEGGYTIDCTPLIAKQNHHGFMLD